MPAANLDEIHDLARSGRFRDALDRVARIAAELPIPEHVYRDRQTSLADADVHHEHGALA